MSNSNTGDDQTVAQIEDLMDQLISQAKDLKQNGYTALDQASGSVAEGILQAQKQAAADLDQMSKAQDSIRNSGADGWDGFKDSFHDFFARHRVSAAESQIERDVRKAAKTADKAEDNAVDSLDYAVTALQGAKVAVLDAVTARAKADEISADLEEA